MNIICPCPIFREVHRIRSISHLYVILCLSIYDMWIAMVIYDCTRNSFEVYVNDCDCYDQ